MAIAVGLLSVAWEWAGRLGSARQVCFVDSFPKRSMGLEYLLYYYNYTYYLHGPDTSTAPNVAK